MKKYILFKIVTLLLMVQLIYVNITNNNVNKIDVKKEVRPFINNITYTKADLIDSVYKEIYDDLLATISIDKIRLFYRPIYSISSKKNTIEKNITILKESVMPDYDDSIIFLLAHSGVGEVAYFRDIYKLQIKDTINIMYNNKKFIYEIRDIYEENKNGYLEIRKKYQHELVISTCSNNDNKQLIVISSLIDKKDI